MKESYGEGLASHPDPESCGLIREGGVEALTGARAGWPSSHEITGTLQGADVFPGTEGNTDPVANARRDRALRGLRPHACTETPCAGTGRSRFRLRWIAPRSVP